MKQPGEQQADRDIFNIDNKGTVTVINQPLPTRSRSEILLLKKVKDAVLLRLEQSLHSAVFIHLGKQSQPQRVRRLLDAEVKIGSKPPEALPAETTILEAFDRRDIAGKLLILGEPGAGKTTTMLDLAKALCDRAEQDATAPIPVLLDLSRWKDPKQTITTWLVEELKSNYPVSRSTAKKCLKAKQLLPLLDGLDEVKPEHQKLCVEAINQWLQSDACPSSLVICSRWEEYEEIVYDYGQEKVNEQKEELRLQLNGAIQLQKLTNDQLQRYFIQLGRRDIWETLKRNFSLYHLVKNPFWLSIVILSEKELPVEFLNQEVFHESQFESLLNNFVKRMLIREIQHRVYTKQKMPTGCQTQSWLAVLAQRMEEDFKTDFLIEEIAPYWLDNQKDSFAYQPLNCLLIGLFLAFFSGLILLNFFNIYIVFLGIFLSLVVGILIGAKIDSDEPVRVVEALKWSWKNSYEGFIEGLKSGIDIITTRHFYYRSGLIWRIFLITVGLLLGLASGVLSALRHGLIAASEVERKASPNQGIRKSAENFANVVLIWSSIGGLNFGVVGHLIFSSIHGLICGLLIGILVGMTIGLFIGLERGGKACIQHLSLRIILFINGSIPWDYARFLNYCTDERLFLQRVGGRYRFRHKYLQEHFAKMGELGVESGMGEGTVRINEDG